MKFRAIGLLFSLCLLGCENTRPTPAIDKPGQADDRPLRLSLEQLKDPKNCQSCHPSHYREWASSMHAYSSRDPVFIAMNKRGQRETNGKLGNFCVNCHAPMAVREGLVSEGGLDLSEAPEWAQGVTCYFCHNAEGLEVPDQHFNANVRLANDEVMRGGFEAVDPGVHGVAKSKFHDRDEGESSQLCGACHDVITDNGAGVHIERTFAEYRKTMFSYESAYPASQDSCIGCHMPRIGERDFVAVNTMLNERLLPPKRDYHEHRWPGVDVALTDDFPGQDEQRLATECELHNSIQVLGIEYVQFPQNGFVFRLETQAGHSQPSGTAQDRRLWMEFVAYDEEGKVMFESGTIKDGEVEELPGDDRPNRQQLAMFRDHMKNASGDEVHMFWEAGRPSESNLLQAGQRPGDTLHYRDVRFRLPGSRKPARVVARMRMRPMGIDVLESLVKSGDLAPEFLNKVPTFTLNGTWVEWRAEDGDSVPQNKLRYVEPIPDICFDRLLRR